MLKCVIKTTNFYRHQMFADILKNYKIPALIEINSSGYQIITYFCDAIPETLFEATEIITEDKNNEKISNKH